MGVVSITTQLSCCCLLGKPRHLLRPDAAPGFQLKFDRIFLLLQSPFAPRATVRLNERQERSWHLSKGAGSGGTSFTLQARRFESRRSRRRRLSPRQRNNSVAGSQKRVFTT